MIDFIVLCVAVEEEEEEEEEAVATTLEVGGGGVVCGLGGVGTATEEEPEPEVEPEVEAEVEGVVVCGGVDILLLPSSSSGIGEGTVANLGLPEFLIVVVVVPNVAVFPPSPSLAVLLPLSLFEALAVCGPTVDELVVLVVPLSPLTTLDAEGECGRRRLSKLTPSNAAGEYG